MKNLKIAIIGFGNAAKSFSEILLNNSENIISKYNINPIITAIATNTRGNIMSDKALHLEQLINTKDYFNHPDFVEMTTEELVQKANYDVLIELTPLNIKNGQPAINYITQAMKKHKHVITANKGPLAHAYQELKSLAEKMGVEFLFETTVMDGTPIFNLVNKTLPFCKILGFEGILNTTTNFILTEMEKGVTMQDALAKGEEQGFVESDPANDLRGYDAAAKVAALANVLMDRNITPQDVLTQGIEGITEEDIEMAKANNTRIKLLCRAKLVNDSFTAEVVLTPLAISHPLAMINGTSSAITLNTDLMKDITVIENSPEIAQTGFGIFSDLITLIESL